MTAPNPERLRELHRSLARLKASRVIVQHADDLLAVEDGIDALLHQLAERDAEVERLRAEREKVVATLGCHPAYLLAELGQVVSRAEEAPNADDYRQLRARATEAERAREEATGLLRVAFDSIMQAAALAGIDPIPEPEPNSIGGRIAAFLAASGGANESR